MRGRLIVIAAAAAILMGSAGAALAASPSSATVSGTSTHASWTGKSFTLGATVSPTACTTLTCDYFTLNVGVSSSYWSTHTGGATIAISWGSSSDNFNLYVYNASGSLVGSSAQSSGAIESVYLAGAAGSYSAVITPALVTSSGYSGSATFSSQSKPGPSPSPQPSPSPSPTGGGGSGGGSSGGGSSGGGGTGCLYGSCSGPGGFPQYGTDPTFYPGAGAGAVYFGDGQRIQNQKQVTFQPVFGTTPATSGQDGRLAALPAGRPGAASPILWLLLPFGLLVLAGVSFVMFEPEADITGRREGQGALKAPASTLLTSLGELLIRGSAFLVRSAARGMTGSWSLARRGFRGRRAN
jgi:hypothetical protein